MNKKSQKNVLGKIKQHVNKYNYLCLSKFPPEQKFIFPQGILAKADRAQFLLGQLIGISEHLPDVNYFISSYVTKDATSSSQIEGTRATLIDAFEYGANQKNKDTDADDIYNYIQALNFGLKRLNDDNFPLSLRLIKELHLELMKNARATHFSDPGHFRKSQNWIDGTNPGNASFVPPAPEEIMDNLSDLEKFMYSDTYHPIVQAGLLHAQFETIHPFLDGNGRTGRLLITFFLIHKKILDKPLLFLSAYFKKHQKVYYTRLQDYHMGNVLPWVEFFLDGMMETIEEAVQLTRDLSDLREKDIFRISKVKARDENLNFKVLQNLYNSPMVSTATMIGWTGFTRLGVKKYIEKLVKVGVLELYKKGEGVNPAVYIHKRYVELFLGK
jgi:Fic family protein